ncbi:MAG TPA: NADH-quinone oxidoreductase subunit H [Clostridiales bacterium]|nr:NADH-quinone oxidoreductase subunit H [Clostridiales bacterium]
MTIGFLSDALGFNFGIWNIVSIIAFVVLAPFVGGLLAGFDRRITARMQGRFGPPILQPFYDVLKLTEKEPITVNKYQDFYIGSFLFFIILTGIFFFAGGDLLLVIFALTLASVFMIVAAFSSNSPYAQAGAERELLQMMAYEPMVLLTAVGFYMVIGTFDVIDVLSANLPAIVYLPGVFIGFVYILTLKFRKSPFDLSMSHHAHQELVKGLSTEFSGKTLAMLEIAHWYENVFLLGIVFLFVAYTNWISVIVAVVVCLLIYFFEVFIDNNFARMKWQVAMNSSWIIALTVGFVNIFVLYFLKLFGVL